MTSTTTPYLENIINDVSLAARTIRKNGKAETQYFLSYKKSPSNLSVNIGDIDKIDEGNYCVLLTEPSYYKDIVQGAPGALVGVPEQTCAALDELRSVIRQGCLEHKVLGAMTHEVLFDLDSKDSMLEPIVRRKEGSDQGAFSMKFPDDTRYYVVTFDEDKKPQLSQLTAPESIAKYRRPGARFIAHVTFASMHKTKLCGCARYTKWVAFLPYDGTSGSSAVEDESSVCLGSVTGHVRVVEE